MSNPAVVQLSSTYIGNTEVRIEDNYAEAIHFHYGNLRIDLTVREFMDLSDKMIDAANQIIDVENFDVREFDPVFLNYYSELWNDLERVEISDIRLGDIIALKYNRLPCYRPLKKCRDFKALTGDPRELNRYKTQTNIGGVTNEERLHGILNSIKKNGYPFNDEYIILRNNQNVILDGQHRASCLLYLYGKDYRIPIMRFHFKDNKYDVHDWHPWRRVIYRKIIDRLKSVSHRFSGSGKIDV